MKTVELFEVCSKLPLSFRQQPLHECWVWYVYTTIGQLLLESRCPLPAGRNIDSNFFAAETHRSSASKLRLQGLSLSNSFRVRPSMDTLADCSMRTSEASSRTGKHVQELFPKWSMGNWQQLLACSLPNMPRHTSGAHWWPQPCLHPHCAQVSELSQPLLDESEEPQQPFCRCSAQQS